MTCSNFNNLNKIRRIFNQPTYLHLALVFPRTLLSVIDPSYFSLSDVLILLEGQRDEEWNS